MSYNEFTLPVKSEVVLEEGNIAKIEVHPCYPGYGVTLGNSLRRVLLSSIEGGAVTSLKIEGVKHEFSTIEGVYESVINIILNVKKLRFKVHTDKPVEVTLKAKGKKKVTAKDIDKNSDAEVINKDQFICELTEAKSEVDIKFTVEKGIGYSPVERREAKKKEIGVIEIDTSFSPVKRVSFNVVNTRIGKRTDYDKLVLEVETDGSVSSYDAFKNASEILSKNYAVLAGIKIAEVQKEVKKVKEDHEEKARQAEEAQKEAKVLMEEEGKEVKKEEDDINQYTLEKIGLPAKLINSLEKENITKVDELIKNTQDDLMKIEGIGESSIKEIKKSLGKYGIILPK
jgi:DNA-directed RNA polymerase subunit alpha